MKKNFYLIILICSLFLIIGCKTEKNPNQSDSDSQTSQPTTQTADNVVNSVDNEIRSSMNSVPDDILSYLKSCGVSEQNKQGVRTSNDVSSIANATANGYMEGLGSYKDDEISPEDSEDKSVKTPHKKQVIQSVIHQLISTLQQNTAEDSLPKAVGAVLFNLISRLESAGVDKEDMKQISGDIIATAISTLKEAEVGKPVILKVSEEILASAVAGVANDKNHLTTAEVKEAVKQEIVSMMDALNKAGVPPGDITNQVETVVESAFKGLGEANVETSDLLDMKTGVKDGVFLGLKNIGLTNMEINSVSEQVENTCNKSIETLIEEKPKETSSSLAIRSLTEGLEKINGPTGVTLNKEQRDLFQNNLTSAIKNAGMTDSTDPEQIMPVLIEEALKTIAKLSPQPSDLEKMDILENILESGQNFLIGRVTGEKAIHVLEKIATTSANHSDKLGLTTLENSDVMKKTSHSLVKNLGHIPLGQKNIQDASLAIVESMIKGIDTEGTSETERYTAANKSLKGAVEGLKKTDMNLDDFDKTISRLANIASKEVVANEIAAKKTEAQLVDSMDEISEQVINAIAEAGVSTATCSEVVSEVISGASDKLANVLNTDDLNKALTKGVEGSKAGLEKAGASREEVESAEKSGMEASDEAVAKTVTPTAAKIIISDEKLSTKEEDDKNGSFKVSLDKSPVDPVTVKIISKDTTEGIVVPDSLEITAENWNKPQTVIIQPQDDGFVDEEVSYSIVLETNDGIRKTLTAKNADNDTVGIKVTPTRKQYTSEVGGQAWYNIVLTSQPKDTIVLRWAITGGASSIDIVENRTMSFEPVRWNSPQVLKLRGKVCADCEEHTSVTVESQNIISVNGTDPDYPALSPASISLTNLKQGPVIQKTTYAGSNTVTILFNKPIFPNVDDAYIYETVFETETISMSYVEYQSRPVLIKNSCTNAGGQILNKVKTISTPSTGPVPGPPTITYSHSFCMGFHNATAGRTQTGLSSWYSGSVSCSDQGGVPNVVTCNFSGSGASPGNNVIPGDTIFNEYTGNSTINLSFTTSGSATSQVLPSVPRQMVRPTVEMSYKALSVVEGKQTAQFRSSSNLQSGYWYLSGYSKSLIKEGGSWSPSRRFYIYVP